MAEAFNPYHEWLGLGPDVAEPSYYQLLGLGELEPDAEKIALAGDRATTRVRSFRPGGHAKQWSQLLDEIFAAKSCLLEPELKAEYDRRLTGTKAEDKGTKPGGPAKPAADSDRYPPGMAPPGARSSAPAQEKALPADAAPLLPPEVSSPTVAAAAAPAWGATGYPAWPQAGYPQAIPAGAAPPSYGVPIAMPLGGYPGTYPMAPAAGTYGVPLAHPYGPQPYEAQAYGAQPYPGAMLPYGAMPPPPQVAGDAVAYFGSPAEMPLDPMAPVVLSGISGATPPGDGSGSKIVGFAGAIGSLLHETKIPLGTAVAPLSSRDNKPSAPLPPAAPQVQRSSSTTDALAERRTQQLRRNLLIAGVGGGALLLAALLVYANLPGADQAETTVAQQNAPPDDGPQPMVRTVESTLPSGKRVPAPNRTPSPAPEPTPSPAPMPEPMPAPSPEPPPMPAPSPPEPMPQPQPTPVPPPMPEPKPEPKPEPTPEPKPEPEPMVTPAELAALSKALTIGRTALTEQNFEEAEQHIAEAESLAKLPEHRAMVARLKEVANYVQQFRKAVEAAALEFEAGETFKVGTSTQVAVVEATSDKIIIRTAGQNKVYPYADLPPGLAVAIADFKLASDDPVTRVVKGAFYTVARGDRQTLHDKAKTWWEEAQLGGVDLAHLMPFLTDNYDLAKQVKKAPNAAKPAETKDEL